MSYTAKQQALATAARVFDLPLDDLIDQQLAWTGCAGCGIQYLAIFPKSDLVLMMECPECGFVHGEPL